MAKNLTPDQRAVRRASRQLGLIARVQALASGLTSEQIKLRLRSGRWVAVAPGVYLIAGTPVTWRTNALAACLAGPPGTVASHLTGAALFGLLAAPVLPHVTIPPGRSPRMRLAVVHRSLVPKVDRVLVDGIPCTSPARTLCDCATLLGFDALAALVDPALARRLARPEAVLDALARAARSPGRRGEALLRQVLDVWSGGILHDSVPEARLLRRLRSWGYPDPIPQFEVYDGRKRLAILDFAWPAQRVGLEYDGPSPSGSLSGKHRGPPPEDLGEGGAAGRPSRGAGLVDRPNWQGRPPSRCRSPPQDARRRIRGAPGRSLKIAGGMGSRPAGCYYRRRRNPRGAVEPRLESNRWQQPTSHST